MTADQPQAPRPPASAVVRRRPSMSPPVHAPRPAGSGRRPGAVGALSVDTARSGEARTGPQPGADLGDQRQPVARLRPGRSSQVQGRRRLPGRPRTAVPEQASPGTRLYEDHDLDATTRDQTWTELVDWVIWLHDRYELSVEERLPDCWPRHPGLVEELAALKAWRAEIYTPPATNRGTAGSVPRAGSTPVTGNGGPARAWHTELRNVLSAAATLYAPGCRAAHRDAPRQRTGDVAARDAWLSARPPTVQPREAPAPTGTTRHTMSGDLMRRALTDGTARDLGDTLPGYAHHQDSWWVQEPGGTWLQITDTTLSARLDTAAVALQTADAAVTRTDNRRERHR